MPDGALHNVSWSGGMLAFPIYKAVHHDPYQRCVIFFFFFFFFLFFTPFILFLYFQLILVTNL